MFLLEREGARMVLWRGIFHAHEKLISSRSGMGRRALRIT